MGGARAAGGRAIAVAGLFLLVVSASMSPALAADDAANGLRADLDGRPLDLVKVGKYFCHDFDYPVIHCFSKPSALEASATARVGQLTSATAVNYAIIYEFTSYQGAYMYLSQDYSLLSLLGWNDRISSLKALNSQTGVFWTDWLYSGSPWTFCCNSQVPWLGTYDNAFSSVYRN